MSKTKEKEMLILTKHEMDCSVKEDNHWTPAQDCEVHIKKNYISAEENRSSQTEVC